MAYESLQPSMTDTTLDEETVVNRAIEGDFGLDRRASFLAFEWHGKNTTEACERFQDIEVGKWGRYRHREVIRVAAAEADVTQTPDGALELDIEVGKWCRYRHREVIRVAAAEADVTQTPDGALEPVNNQEQ
ncbi:unnamed protein product [Schistocephalus solidus]|uniref:Archease domain-containing protein n=1 Tax=Schistocephalus solidus TaxID=70667 RepID=A0A183TA18_SCHSO|nr:unnamed protein product [Schistocephalus solidus]